MPLRRYLVILAALTILPLLAFTAWIVLDTQREARARATRALTDTTRALSLAIDRDVAALVAALESLATARELDTGDLRTFYAHARALQERDPRWATIILADPAGNQLVNLLQPLGTPLPRMTASDQSLRDVVGERRAVITEAFV